VKHRPACPPPRRVPRAVLAALVLAIQLPSGCVTLKRHVAECRPLPRARGLAARDLETVLTLPESEIDLGRAALLVARPELEGGALARALARLDAVAQKVRRRVGTGASPREAILEMNAVVLDRGRLPPHRTLDAGDVPAPLAGAEQFDPVRVLETGEGDCVARSILYLAVAERAGLPFRLCVAPGHVFVRYDDGLWRANVETTRGGRCPPDLYYCFWRRARPEALARGAYLRSESKREALATVLALHAGFLAREGRLAQAEREATLAIAVKPRFPPAYVNRGVARYAAGRREEALADYRAALACDPASPAALNNLAISLIDRPRPAPGDVARARRLALRALQASPRGDRRLQAGLHRTAARTLALAGEPRAALRHLALAARCVPDRVDYRRAYDEALVAWRAGRPLPPLAPKKATP